MASSESSAPVVRRLDAPQLPSTLLTRIDLDPALALGDQHAVLERRNRLVLRHLRMRSWVSVVGESTSMTNVGSGTRSSSGARARQTASTSGHTTAVAVTTLRSSTHALQDPLRRAASRADSRFTFDPAVRGRREDGIVAGGGVALLYAARALDGLEPASDDQPVGIDILRHALEQPVREIAHHAGIEGSVGVGKLLDQPDADTASTLKCFDTGI